MPPVQKVLGEREAMVAKTTEDKPPGQRATGRSRLRLPEGDGRGAPGSGIRDEARAEAARSSTRCGRANEEAASTLQQASDELKQQSDAIAADLRSSVETLSANLASRVLGVPVANTASTTSASAPGR